LLLALARRARLTLTGRRLRILRRATLLRALLALLHVRSEPLIGVRLRGLRRHRKGNGLVLLRLLGDGRSKRGKAEGGGKACDHDSAGRHGVLLGKGCGGERSREGFGSSP
jgi:hypothetical protein